MSKPIFCYIAGPYSKPDPVVNTAKAIAFGNWLLDHGYRPFIPHLSMWQNMAQYRPWREWLDIDFDWIAKCDVLIRLPGESTGADQECELAAKLGIPAFAMHADDPNCRHRVLSWLEDFAESRVAV